MTRGYHSHLHVAHLPRKPAIIDPVRDAVNHGQLETRSNRTALEEDGS